MKLTNFVRIVAPYIPAFLSVGFCFGIIYSLAFLLPETLVTEEKLQILLLVVIIISILLIILFAIFIFTKTNQLRFSGNSLSEELHALTQKLHHFRNIVDVLVRSKIWAPGLKEYIDEEFEGLNFFHMKEFYKGKSKIALEYIEESNRYGEIESLYLEAKSLLINDPTKSEVGQFSNPRLYDKRILQKWVEHKCGSGLWYFFGYKYSNFKDELEVSRVFERHEEKILSNAVQIDLNRYQNMGFSEELLSKLGEQISEDVIPRLHSLTLQSQRQIPGVINTTYILLVSLTVFGVFQPLAALILQLPAIISYITLGIVLGILLFIVLSIYPYVSQEVNPDR